MASIYDPAAPTVSSSDVTDSPYGNGLHITGTDGDNAIAGSAFGDLIEGSLGNDLINGAGKGTSGQWSQDLDTVSYSENLYVLNRSTGEQVKAFNIIINADKSVTVTRTDLSSGENDSSDILFNIGRITFGTDENRVEIFLDQRESVWMWQDGEGNDPRRAFSIEGGIADDLIQGTDQQDRLKGGAGNDIILGDVSSIATSSIIAGGGNPQSRQMPNTNDGTSTSFTISLGEIPESAFIGVDSNNAQTARNLKVDLTTATTITFNVNGPGNVSDATSALAVAGSVGDFVNLVSVYKTTGLNIDLWVQHDTTLNVDGVDTPLTGVVLLDIFDKENYSSGDRMEGGEGNDFMDGGLSGNQTQHTWNNNNEVSYAKNADNYQLKQITLATDAGNETAFNDGTLISSWWTEVRPSDSSTESATFSQLVTNLGLKDAPIKAGEYAIVNDLKGDDGIDVLAHVQHIAFGDKGILLETEVRSIDRHVGGGPAGTNYNGSLFGDQITGTDGYDQINSQGGNDIVIAGAGGDRINSGTGNDYVDGGASGSHYNNRWEDVDEVRFSGSAKRYDIKLASKVEVEAFWVENFSASDTSGLTYSADQQYFFVNDLSPNFGNGSTLLTNVDRINFEDDQVWLNISVEAWDANPQGDRFASLTAEELRVEGTQFNDTVIAADVMADRTAEDLWRMEFNGKQGDDVFIGDDMGSRVQDGAGNDMIIGGGSPALGEDRWFGQDEVSFNGLQARYTIEQYQAGHTVLDSEGNIIYDLSQVSSGIITTADGKAHSITDTSSKIFVVRDLMPDQFEGNGINLLMGVEQVNFEDGGINLAAEVYENSWVPIDENYTREIHVRGTLFDDIINTEESNLANDENVNNWVEADDGNDYIFTGGGSDEIRPGKGNDFVDGGAVSVGESDTMYFGASAKNFEVTQATEAQVLDFWSINFSAQTFIYQSTQSYFFVTDSNLLNGYGTNLVTNIDRINFSDASIHLEIRVNAYTNEQDALDHYQIDGTDLDDVITSTRLDNPSSVDIYANAGAGNDVIMGSAENNHFSGGVGNDLIIGGASSGHGDSANFSNIFSRYDVAATKAGDVIYQVEGDSSSAVIYDLSKLSDGIVITQDGTEHTVGSYDSGGFVVRDVLSDSLGGAGIDLLLGIEQMSFSDDRKELDARIWDNNRDGTPQVEINLNDYDSIFDASAGVKNSLDNLTTSGRINGNAGNDTVIGFEHGTQFTGGSGDDIFISPTNFDGSDDDEWSHNEAQFSGPASRYIIDTGSINTDSSNIPVLTSDGEIQWSDSYKVGYQSAIRVTDLLSDVLGGDGTDYLIGIHAINFETGNTHFEVGTTSRSETWDFWTDADFRNQYDNVGDSINNALLADKQEGSRFDDTLTADSNILVALPDTWSEVAISSEMFTALVYGSNPLFFEYTNNNQELKAVIPLGSLTEGASITAKLWVENTADADYLNTAIYSSNPIDLSIMTGEVELHATTANPSDGNDDVFSHFKFNINGGLDQIINNGFSYLQGQKGHDTLIGSAYVDVLHGGGGNDLLIGGANGNRHDQARYDGLKSQFTIENTWVKLDINNNLLAESATQIDASYQSALVVTDTDTSASGEGRDILIGIEEIEFNDKTRLKVGISSSLELQDGYYPGVNLYDGSLTAFPHFNIETADITDTVYVQDILDQYSYTPYHSTSDFGFDLTTDSYRTVTATEGDDTLFGLATNTVWSTSSKGDDVYMIKGVALEQLAFTQGYDNELGKKYVVIEHTPLFEGALDLGTNRLYDFEQVEIQQPGSWDGLKFPLTLNPSLEPGQWQGFGFSAIEDSLFDDTINDVMITTFGTPPGLYQGISVTIRGGNDTVDISTGSVFVGQEIVAKWDYNNGNDYISTGHGLDIYSANKELSEYEIRYFIDANNNKLRDAGEEITLDTFRTEGVTIYDGNNAHGLAGNEIITYADYLATDSSLNLFNGVGEIWDRGAVWIDYSDNYYVEVAHAVPDSLNGTGVDVLHDVEIFKGRVSGESAILDLLSGSVHSNVQLFPLAQPNLTPYDPADVVTQDVGSDLTSLRTTVTSSDSRTDINLIDDATSVKYNFDPNIMTFWSLDLEYDGKDDHNTNLTGTDGDITLTSTDKLYVASGTAITDANIAAVADSAPIASLQAQADNFANNADISFYARDNVHLGTGNDIINLMGEAQQSVKGAGFFQDNLFLDLPFERLNITYGELDSSGHITNAESFFANFVGIPNQKYTRVSDKLADDLGGVGINYLIEVDWITPDGNDWIAGEMSSWFVDYGDVARIRTVSTDVDSLFAPTQLPIIQAAIDNGTASGVIIGPTTADGVYIGIDDGNYVENLWLQDLVMIGAESASFTFERVHIGLADDRSDVARDSFGKVVLYQADGSVTAGHSLKSAVLMQDQITDTNGGYGTKILIDFEQVIFNNWAEEIDISHRLNFWENDDNSGVSLNGSLLDDTFVLDQDVFTALLSDDRDNIEIRDGAGNDTSIILSKQLNVEIKVNIGNDYTYLGEELGAAVPDDSWYQVDLRTYDSSRFIIEQVSVVVDVHYRVAKDGSGKWLLANSNDANTQEALLITDILKTGSDLGSNLIVGIDRVNFLDGELRTGVTESTHTQDDNGVTFVEIQQQGSAFSERLSFKVDSGGAAMDVRNNLQGMGGNDTLIGANNGDRLSGGIGDDLIIGAGNGDSVHEWRNFDRAEYDVSTWARLTVEGVRVGYDQTKHTLLLDANNDILFNPNTVQLGSQYQLTSAYQVNDVVSPEQGGFGSDILIGVEQISITNSSINLGVTTQVYDWDGDGNIDHTEVRGSNFNDSILSVIEGGDVEDATFLARNNNINAEGGNDNVYAGAGGDWISLGAGNDFVDGGSNLGTNNWGGDNQDEVRFNANQSNYILNSTVFAGVAEDVVDLSSTVVFKILGDGQILRVNSDGVETPLATIELGDRYTTVQDQTPSGALGGEGTNLLIGIETINFEGAHLRLEINEGQNLDKDGNLQHAWLKGTSLGDVLIGHDYNEDIRGYAGNDLLYGGAGGDRLNGGEGDDILIGGANGTSGDNWRDLDQAEYWQYSSAQASITKTQVGLGADGKSLLLDTNGEVVLDPTAIQLGASYTATSAFQIASTAGFGTDTLVGVERLSFKDQQIDLLITSREDDWNNDEIIDWSEISGTAMADVIGNAAHGGDLEGRLLNANNYINAKGGDDNIWAMAGGDDIRPGGGNDYINGGSNGTNDGSGHIRKDGVNFSGAESRYVINSMTFQGAEIVIRDLDDTVVFRVSDGGSIQRQDTSGNHTLLDTLTSGQTITQVTDLMPGGVLGGEGVNLMVNVEYLNFGGSWMGLEVDRNLQYDSNGNITNSWINGTAIGDIDLTGTIVGDSINGNAGDDTLIGLQGNDHFTGGTGNDTIWGDLQNSDEILAGQDVARFEGLQKQFSISRVDTTINGKQYQAIRVTDLLTAELGGSGTDTLYGIEALSFNDSWVRVGVDVHEQKDSNGNVIERHYNGSQFDDVITGSDLTDSLNGGAGNDQLTGGAGGDHFEGGEGNDTIYGGAEGIDAWGNARVDTARFIGKWSDHTIQHYDSVGSTSSTFDADGYVTVQVKTSDNSGDIDTLHGIERLEFSDRSVSFASARSFTDANGDGIPDWAEIRGTTEAETLTGSELNDVIYGDAGDDIINGGEGDDIISGDEGTNTIDGGDGNDVFGNTYVDTAKFTGKYADYSISQLDNTWTVSLAGTSADTLTNIEVLEFSDMSLNLVTDVATRDFDKDGSIDFVHLTGTLGDNTFNSNDSSFGDTIWSNGSSVDYYLNLGAGDDTAKLGSGDDTMFDHLGTDSYDGGDGFDTLQLVGKREHWTFDFGASDGSVTITDTDGNNTKTLKNIEQVQFSDQMMVLTATTSQLDTNGDGINETVLYAGTEGADSYSATADANLSWILNGNAGDDSLTGGSANDRLNGGDDDDQLSGGAGSDTAVFNTLTQAATITQVKLTSSGSILSEDAENGTLNGFKVTLEDTSFDLLIDMEVIEFSDGLISLTKSEEVLSSFSLSTGLVDTRYVTGTQFDDTLNSSSDQDEMTGGAGNDTFVLIETGYKTVTVTDFEGLDINGAAQDILQFDATDTASLFGINVGGWFTADVDIATGNAQLVDSDASNDVSAQALIDAANTTQKDIVTNILKAATFDPDTGNASFRFGDDNVYLTQVAEADLSVNNIDIV